MRTVYPMLTPMVFDGYHTFPTLKNNRLLFGVVTKATGENPNQQKACFIQVPSNLPRFFEIAQPDGLILFIPIEEIIRHNIHNLFRNVELLSVNLFRISRNGDFTLEESEDIESNFLEELKRKLQTRRTGRVVRLDIQQNPDPWLLRLLKIQWDLDACGHAASDVQRFGGMLAICHCGIPGAGAQHYPGTRTQYPMGDRIGGG